MKLRLSAIPSLAGWGFRFLRNSTPSCYLAATKANFLLAQYSVKAMRALTERLNLAYDSSFVGTLKIFRTKDGMDHALAISRMLSDYGLSYDVLKPHDLIDLEPALGPVKSELVGAMYFPGDGWGDPKKFADELLGLYRGNSGQFEHSRKVTRLLVEGNVIKGVICNDDTLLADTVIVAAGIGGGDLLASVGIKLPIQPVKGYTITIPLRDPDGPSYPIVDDSLHAAIVPLDGALRIAGTAEFCGRDYRIRQERIDTLIQLLVEIYPNLAPNLDLQYARAWAGLRPMSALGSPHIGPTPVKGLYVNGGHGQIGWTTAIGSASLLADLIDGTSPAIDPRPFFPLRTPTRQSMTND
jgi:D-amino-acid dehydrogenase